MKDASSKAVEARKAKTVEAYKESLDKLTGEAEKLEVFLRESLYHDSPLSVVRDNFRKVGSRSSPLLHCQPPPVQSACTFHAHAP